jgi:hypothetical protein
LSLGDRASCVIESELSTEEHPGSQWWQNKSYELIRILRKELGILHPIYYHRYLVLYIIFLPSPWQCGPMIY